MRIGHVGDAEVDNLDRIVFHHKNVARLEVPVDQTPFVCRLQASAGLRNNPDRALDSQAVAGLADKDIERRARQKRHDEVGLFLAVFFEFADVENLNNVGMAHGGEHVTFLVEQLERGGIWNIENRLDRDFAANHGVIGSIDQTHPALAENFPHLVAASQFSRCDRTFHEPLSGGNLACYCF